jgi:hypothetical protein
MKELSEIGKDVQGYYFECRWDVEVDIASEIQEGREHCAVVSVFEVPFITPWNQDPHKALVRGRDEMHVQCVRSYLLDFKGWSEPLAGAGV